jgi:site-specific DNA-methyltransferase (adenine-specific)
LLGPGRRPGGCTVTGATPPAFPAAANVVHGGENLAVLRGLPDGLAQLIYVDPPFNTGQVRRYTRLRTVRDEAGDRVGFGGARYATTALTTRSYGDQFDDYLAWLAPRLAEARRVLASDGTLYLHCDPREVHYIKVLLDGLFGRASFLNEVIWAYDFGGRSKRRWPAKHDNILVYVKDPRRYTFNADAVDRLPYLAPRLAGPAKAARGKLPTDVWWQTIVPTTGAERTGYPTQKPLAILRRIVAASSNPGETVLDFCAGSGTTGMAAHALGRRFYLIDNHPEALAVMARRLAHVADLAWLGDRPPDSAGPEANT